MSNEQELIEMSDEEMEQFWAETLPKYDEAVERAEYLELMATWFAAWE